ncbi:MAG: alpha/beta hydrolase [Alphaproteobacteria bacterium]
MDLANLSAGELEAQLNPRVAVADAERHLAAYAARSRAARERLAGRYDIAYGPSPLQTLDVFTAPGPHPPIHVFLHGGYWRSLDKSDFSFVAEPLVGAGATTVLLNYDLCPAVTLDAIVCQINDGIAWVHRHAAELGGDGERLFVSGHSAGAHLALMALAHDWAAEGLPADTVKGVVGVSGVYDLAPLLRISVNADVRLDAEMARRNSPTLAPPRTDARLLLAVGGDEPPLWIKQTTDMRDRLVEAGVACELVTVADRNHFTILYDQADAESELCRALRAQMSLG